MQISTKSTGLQEASQAREFPTRSESYFAILHGAWTFKYAKLSRQRYLMPKGLLHSITGACRWLLLQAVLPVEPKLTRHSCSKVTSKEVCGKDAARPKATASDQCYGF